MIEPRDILLVYNDFSGDLEFFIFPVGCEYYNTALFLNKLYCNSDDLSGEQINFICEISSYLCNRETDILNIAVFSQYHVPDKVISSQNELLVIVTGFVP